MAHYDFPGVEREAKTLYVQGAYDTLIDTWNAIPVDQKTQCPEIAFNTARALIARGRHPEARIPLDTYMLVNEGEHEKIARAYLMHAQIALNTNDLDGTRFFVTKVQDLSENERHLAECQYLLGEAIKPIDAKRAMIFYEQAVKGYRRARVDDPVCDFDIVRVCVRASQVAFRQSMRGAGWRYQDEAEFIARTMEGNEDLLSYVLVCSGDAQVNEGRFQEAIEAYSEAARICTNYTRAVEIRCELARLAALMGDDVAARQYPGERPAGDHVLTVCQYLLAKAWVAAFRYELREAAYLLDEIETMQADDRVLIARVTLLRGLIAAQEGRTEELAALQKAIHFFEEERMLIESSQARIILAWLQTFSGDEIAAQNTIQMVEQDIAFIGHVNHLFRLYEASLLFLGGWWRRETITRFEAAAGGSAVRGGDNRVRIYVMGIPRIYINGRELPYPDRGGQLGLKALVYMLEKREVPLWELIHAVYDEPDPERAKDRFYVAMSTFKKKSELGDWCTFSNQHQAYVLREGFPDFCDLDAFKDRYQMYSRAKDPVQRASIGMKLLNSYDEFARGIYGDAFEEIRMYYHALYDGILIGFEEDLAQLQSRIPRDWYEQLHARIVTANHMLMI